jgi:predicted transcriptional regulator
MKRRTISLPDEVAAHLEREAERRRVPVSQFVREAIEVYLHRPRDRRIIRFAGLGDSGHGALSEDVEEILRDEWGHDRDR